MAKQTKSAEESLSSSRIRNILALFVTFTLIIGLIVFAIFILAGGEDTAKSDAVKIVLTSLLPLFASWVGMVLAFFFSNENLQTATKSVVALTQQGWQEKLKSIPALEKMIKKNDIKGVMRLTPDKILVSDAVKNLDEQKVNRLVLLNADDAPQMVIHRSILDRFLSDKGQLPPEETGAYTIENVLKDAKTGPLLRSTFETVDQNATLAQAKANMDMTPNCSDIFVTKSGSRSEAILGWITDVIIKEFSKV